MKINKEARRKVAEKLRADYGSDYWKKIGKLGGRPKGSGKRYRPVPKPLTGADKAEK